MIESQYENEIFNETFERFYNNGYFGQVDKEQLKYKNNEWFLTILDMIDNRSELDLLMVLLNSNNKLIREWFYLITGIDIRYKNKNSIVIIVNLFSNNILYFG